MPTSKKSRRNNSLEDFLIRKKTKKTYFAYLVIISIGLVVFFGVATLFPDLFTKAQLDPFAYSSSISSEDDSEELTPKEQSFLEELYERLKGLERRIELLEKKTVITPEPAPQPTPEPISYKTYIVQPKDYLILIAQKVYGNGGRWYELVNLNKDKYPEMANPPYLIKIGWELKY